LQVTHTDSILIYLIAESKFIFSEPYFAAKANFINSWFTFRGDQMISFVNMIRVNRLAKSSKLLISTIRRASQWPVFPKGKALFDTPQSESLNTIINLADQKKKMINENFMNVAPSFLDIFRKKLTYTSNALEGNSMTEKQVFTYIDTGVTIGGKPLSDHLDIASHDKAVKFLFSLASKRVELSPEIVKDLHKMACPVTEQNAPGEYKKLSNMTFTTHPVTNEMMVYTYVAPEDVRDEIAELLFWLKENEAKHHAIYLASISHYNFARIHPFPDGNGRVARLLMNLMLLRKGFCPTIIYPEQREEYIRLLNVAKMGDILPFTEFIGNSLLETQNNLIYISSPKKQ